MCMKPLYIFTMDNFIAVMWHWKVSMNLYTMVRSMRHVKMLLYCTIPIWEEAE